MTSTPPAAPSGPRTPRRTLTSRTTLVTAAAIAGVLIAGTAAVAANIGILNAADDSALGELAATDELLPQPVSGQATVEAVETTAPPSTAPETTLPAGTARQYDIEGAGSVWVMTTTSGLALDHVVAVPGWSPLLSQGDLRSLRVDFTNGERTIVFTASLGADGTVVVDVTEPSTVIAQAPAAAATPSPVGASPTTSSGYDDDDDDDEYEEEYEDEHEYEGADDDD
jgi:hypothetical protein